MFAHGNSRMELLVTGTLPLPPRAGGEKEQPNSPAEFPSLSRKIKSSFNPRDPKQGERQGGGSKNKGRPLLRMGKKTRRSSSGEHAVSAIDYAEMKFHPATIPRPAQSFSTPPPPPPPPALNIFKLSPLENSALRASSPNKSHEEARSGRRMGI